MFTIIAFGAVNNISHENILLQEILYSIPCTVYTYIHHTGYGLVMSFWDVAGKVGKFALNTARVVAEGVNEKANELKETRDKFEQKSDEDLIKITKSEGVFGSSSSDRAMATQILKKRGIEPASY
jgi:hypothetical protein